MPVSRSFLQPRSVTKPSQGDFQYTPIVEIFEADSAAGLQALLVADVGAQSVDNENFWVIESIEYQVAVPKPAIGMNPAEMKYSALVWATQVKKV